MAIQITQEIIASYQQQSITKYLLTDTCNNFSIAILNYGAIIYEINTPDKDGNIANIVINQEPFNPLNPDYLGALIGRVAGRISNAKFSLKNTLYQLDINTQDGHHLHGGLNALDKKVWQVSLLSDGLELSYLSPDGENGFPGSVNFTVSYRICKAYQLTIEVKAKPSQETILNLTNHSYFALNHKDNFDQILQINSDYVAAINHETIPTGELFSVKNTPFDLRSGRNIYQNRKENHPQLQQNSNHGYDHPFILNSDNLWPIELSSQSSGRFLKISTSEPICVVYSANHFAMPGLAVALETQKMPNAINMPKYKNQLIYSPQNPYESTNIWQFGVTNDK